MAFEAILASLFIKLPLSSTAPILRQSTPLHTSASAVGGSYDNAFQKTTKQVSIIKGS